MAMPARGGRREKEGVREKRVEKEKAGERKKESEEKRRERERKWGTSLLVVFPICKFGGRLSCQEKPKPARTSSFEPKTELPRQALDSQCLL